MGCKMRPCIVKDTGRKALFHRWVEVSQIVPPSVTIGGHNGGVLALVETETGDVRQLEPSNIRFLDSKELFSEYIFEEEGRV